MEVIVSEYYENLAQIYTKKNWEKFFKNTSALIRYTRRIPIYYFYTYHEIFMQYIEKYGAAPYLSWIIEYGYRLLRQRNKISRTNFVNLVKTFKKTKKEYSRVPVMIRRSKKYRLISINSGYALATLLLSNFGIRHSFNRFAPYNFLRVAALLGECSKLKAQSDTLEPDERDHYEESICKLYADLIKSKMGEGNKSDLDGHIGNMLNEGIRNGILDCLTSLLGDTMVDIIDKLEDYMECRGLGRQRNEQDNIPSVGDPRDDEIFGDSNLVEEDENVVTDSLEAWGNVIKDSLSGFPMEHFGGWQSITENDDGSFLVERSSDGINVDSSVTYDTFSREISYSDSRGRADFTNNSDGSTTVTTTTTNDATGSTITVTTTVDSDGNQVGESEVTITQGKDDIVEPSDEDFYSDPCTDRLVQEIINLTKQYDKGGRLDPYIIPDPDSPMGLEADACLSVFDNSQPTKCLSPILCLEGYTPGKNCQCKSSEGASLGDIPSLAGSKTCTQVICGDLDCDPSTGTCGGGGLEFPFYAPGVRNTIPLPIGSQILSNSIGIHQAIDKKIGDLQKDFDKLILGRRPR